MTENPGSRNPLLKGRGAVTCAAPPRGRDQPRRRSSQNSTNTTNNNTLHPGAWWLWSLGLATAHHPHHQPPPPDPPDHRHGLRRGNPPHNRPLVPLLHRLRQTRPGRTRHPSPLRNHPRLPIPGTHPSSPSPNSPPHWAQGIRLGGEVTTEALLFAFYDGLRLATLLICVGAANALANPARLLKSLPGALYETGVAVVVALTFAPNLIADAQRLRAARRLRGRPDRGLRGLLQVGLPVLEGALERSVALAAAMDARGYGRTADVPASLRRTTTALTLGGLLGICAGTYGLLTAEGAAYGLPLLLAGVVAALAGLRLGGRRTLRTRYRPDPWDLRAWLVTASGVAVAALLTLAAARDPAALTPG